MYKLKEVQHLRFVAAVLVLFGHVFHETEVIFGAEPVVGFDFGIGVDIFFVISGFIMMLTSGDRFGRVGGARHFLVRRIERVAPLYWVFTTLMLLAIVLAPSRIDNAGIDLEQVVSSYLFFPVPRDDGLIRPVLALGWTLNYEMFFYMVFAGCMFLPPKAGPWALVSVLVVLVAAHPWLSEWSPALGFWSDPILLEFVAGMGLAAVYRKGVRLGRIGGLLMMCTGVALAFLLYKKTGVRAVDLGVPAAVFCSGWLLGKPLPGFVGPVGQMFGFGGDASYSLYLSHPFSLNVIALFLVMVGVVNAWLYIVLSVVGAMTGAAAVYWWIERPIMGWFRRPVGKPAVKSSLPS